MRCLLAAIALVCAVSAHPPPSISLRWRDGAAPPSLVGRRLGEHSYSYVCEATQPCTFPFASARDYFDHSVDVQATAYTVGPHDEMTKITDVGVINHLPTSKPTQYRIKYEALDSAGNNATQVTVNIAVKDTVKPTITVCGNVSVVIEASLPYAYCNATAHDNIDGDISPRIITTLLYNGHEMPGNGLASAGAYGPHDMAKRTGTWLFKYRVSDSSGNVREAQKVVAVVDSNPPNITIKGADVVQVECTENYTDAGATASDLLDGEIAVRTYGVSQWRSCNDIKMFKPQSTSGWYEIEAKEINGGQKLSVWCDMETDGGGYTYYPIDGDGGISTSRYDAANNCTALGLQLAVWRTKAHMHAMLHKYGTQYFATVPGVYGTGVEAGHKSFSRYAMYSTNPEVESYWHAIDGGSWFMRDTPFAQPNGDYTDGCWLGVYGLNPLLFNDDECKYETGPNYVCSTNDKGGPGVLHKMENIEVNVEGLAQTSTGKRYPPAVPGDYTVVYQATDKHGLDAVPKTRRVNIRDTILPEITVVPFAGGNPVRSMNLVWHNETYGGDVERARANFSDPGYSCADGCDANVNLTTWWDDNLEVDPFTGGIYVKRYDCEDASGNLAKSSRSWVFIDNDGPMVAINGTDPFIVEARMGLKYVEVGDPENRCIDPERCIVDPGARCTDAEHYYIMKKDNVMGKFDDLVVTSGANLVDATVPADYLIEYNCVVNGTAAPSVTRTVRVQDTTCPELVLKWAETEMIEAGFPYYPPSLAEAVYAYDTLDGNLTASVEVRGDTVDVSKAFVTRSSCAEIKTACDNENHVCPSGNYTITVYPERHNRHATGPRSKGVRMSVYCDMDTDGGGYTLYPVVNGKPITRHTDAGDCAAVGMQVVIPRTANHFSSMIEKYNNQAGRNFFEFVPGVYGTKNGTVITHLKDHAMQCTGVYGDQYDETVDACDSEVQEAFRAIDGGDWFIRDTAYGTATAFSNYRAHCYLGMDHWQAGEYKFFTSDSTGTHGGCPVTVDTYLCSTNDKGGPGVGPPGPARPGQGVKPEWVEHKDTPGVFTGRAEIGMYEITYHVRDSAGLKQCNTPRRTVIVKDTMKPQITLKYKGAAVAQGGVSVDGGIGGVGKAVIREGAGHGNGDLYDEDESKRIRDELPSNESAGIGYGNHPVEGDEPEYYGFDGARRLAEASARAAQGARGAAVVITALGAVGLLALGVWWRSSRASIGDDAPLV